METPGPFYFVVALYTRSDTVLVEVLMKQCKECKMSKELAEFKKDPKAKDGTRTICKLCSKKQQQKARADRRVGIGLTTVVSKTCNRCLETKLPEEFFKDSGCKDGLSTLCKPCRNISTYKYRAEHKDEYNAYMRDLRATEKEMFKNIDLKRTYGITLEKYKEMLKEQDHVCALCKNPQKGKRPLVVDHCHTTGQIRGLLCYGCNRFIVALDNHPMQDKAIAYLEAIIKDEKKKQS